jgi:hypothetical protein
MAETGKTAARLVSDLMRELDLTREQALGLVGNLAHESAGFKDLTENGVGGKGGYGYAQWTGSRRKEFESFAKKEGLKPSSYEANLGFMVKELRGKESGALRRIRQAETADQAASVAMKSYFRPGTPHLDRRQDWTNQFDASIPNSALAAIDAASPPALPGRRPDSSLAFAPKDRVGNFSTETRYAAGAGRGAKGEITYKAPAPRPRMPMGMISPGNINPDTRPTVKNPDGSISTVRTISFNTDGREVLIPTVVGNKVVSDDEAIDNYFRTGQSFGSFKTPQAATAFAERLHNTQANQYLPKTRVAGGVQGIAGARRDASGSATVRPPAISGLTSRSVKTIPIAPGNTRVPTTNLEQLQLALERQAPNYVDTATRVAQAQQSPVRVAGPTTPPRPPVTVSGAAKGYTAPVGRASGSVTLAPRQVIAPKAPSNAPGQTWGVGGANQAGTTRMGAPEPSIMPAMREQMAAAVAAQNAKPSVRVTATPIAGVQKAASGSVTYKAPTTGPTQAQLEAIRRVPAPISVSGSAVGIPGAGKAASGWISATGAPRDLGSPQYGTPGMGGGTLGANGLAANAFVEKKYNDRLNTPALSAANGVGKTPIQITVKGGASKTGPFLPLSADAGARARANALIAANPIPRTLPIAPRMAPVPLPRPMQVSAPVSRSGRAPVGITVLGGNPASRVPGGLLGMLFGGGAPVARIAAPAPASAGYITTPYEQSWAQTTENALMPSYGSERRQTGY